MTPVTLRARVGGAARCAIMRRVSDDEKRTAALQLWPQHGPKGRGEPDREGRRQLGVRRLPVPQPRRFLQALAQKGGRLGWEADVVEPLTAYRRAVLGAAAAGQPRALVRVDEFPHARAFDSAGRFGSDAFRRFHAVLAEAGIPYLLAITPHVSRDYLDPDIAERRDLDEGEIEILRSLPEDGVTFGLHGADHRTRHPSPRQHSEFCGLSLAAAAERIDDARATFDALGLATPAFVPPFNRFDAAQYPLLAERFEIVCGGPESVRLLGFHRTPVWQGEAVYLPSYAPLYGTAAEATAGIERLAELEAALWAPITLHWGWELKDDFASLRRLCEVLQGRVASWTDFLAAIAASGGGA
jgi:peptidoglycan/xylan/chitin deacetylase (PgdA/CDA1 family)